MKHDLVGVILSISGISFTPVVADGVGKNRSISVESTRRDGPTDRWITLESVLGHSIPEMKCAIRPSCAECAVLGVEGNGVN